MNIVLRTNTYNPYLELHDVQRRGPNYSFYLIIRSGPFEANKSFWVEVGGFEQFLEQIVEMDKTLRGKAILKPYFEPEYVAVEMLSGGHISVRGELFVYDAISQQLQFGFETDQTCLSPFIADLKTCMEK